MTMTEQVAVVSPASHAVVYVSVVLIDNAFHFHLSSFCHSCQHRAMLQLHVHCVAQWLQCAKRSLVQWACVSFDARGKPRRCCDGVGKRLMVGAAMEMRGGTLGGWCMVCMAI